MMSVLILDGFSEPFDSEISCTVRAYIPLVEGLFIYNGIRCETVNLKGLERRYLILGKSNDALIYVPEFTFASPSSKDISFIYTEQTSSVSKSFKIASILRNKRSDKCDDNVIFVEQLKDGDPLKSFSPVIVDNIRLPEEPESEQNFKIGMLARCLVESVAEYYGFIFKDPFKV